MCIACLFLHFVIHNIMNLPDPGSLLISQVVNNTLNPVWNQTFDFVVEDGLHDMLMVEIWDHDTFGKVKKGKEKSCIIYKFATIFTFLGALMTSS